MARKPRGLGGFFDAAKEAYGEGREEWSKAFRQGRKAENKTENAPRITEMVGAYPTGIRGKELLDDALVGMGLKKLSKNEAEARLIREDLGIGAKEGFGPRAGQIAGTIGADLTQDNTRSFYWLLNAAQATGNVINESVMGSKLGNPSLYDNVPVGNVKTAKKGGEYLDGQGRPRKGVNIGDKGVITKRRFEPGHLAALGIPTGIAINTGLGLLTPFGGAEGYKAAVPSEEDPTKTDNVLAEVGLKYLMGSTGKMLPYSEFAEVRPDVSPEEYKAYQAFKYDKPIFDVNPFDDGQMGILAGAVKTTDEGVHGPELQFLGRSLPVTTGIVPYIGALAGGVAGVRTKRPIVGGVAGGMAGLAVGQIAGSMLENERRRRNAAENELNNPQGLIT